MKYTTLLLLAFCPFLVACGKSPQSATPQQLEYSVPVGVQKYVDPENGRETWFAFGAMAGVGGTNANGVVQAHRFESGLYRIELQLNIERAQDEEYYEAWLAKEGDQVIVMAGQLHSNFGDARHTLIYESTDDLRDYTNMIVTRELDDGNPQPNERIAEGILKVTQR